MNLFVLLASEASSSSANSTAGTISPIQYVFFAVVIVALIAYMIYSSIKRKKYQGELEQKMNSLEPGDYIVTIGSLCGIIEEIEQDGSVVIKTGSDAHPGYIRVAKDGICRFKKASEIKAESEPFVDMNSESFGTKVEDEEQAKNEENAENEPFNETENVSSEPFSEADNISSTPFEEANSDNSDSKDNK